MKLNFSFLGEIVTGKSGAAKSAVLPCVVCSLHVFHFLFHVEEIETRSG